MKLSTDQINTVTFFILVELFFLLIIYKVFNIPITHDETATTVHYSMFSYWQIMMYPDNWPNNHILNTLLTKFLISIFGSEQWVVRLPNLLSFLVYALGIFRINKTVLKTSSLFFIPATILFIWNPYLLDFFGLSRGYAMSCALSTLSTSYIISGFQQSNKRQIWAAFFLATLASYANFTLLVFWVAVIFLALLNFFIQAKQTGKSILRPTLLLIFLSISYLALIAVPIIKMQTTNQFQYWVSDGFYQNTILSLVKESLYGASWISNSGYHIIAISIIVLIAGNIVYLSLKFFRSENRTAFFQTPVFVATCLLLFTAITNILQCLLLRTPNLSGRTALFFYPLFITSLVTTIGLIPNQEKGKTKGLLSFLMSCLLLFQVSATMKLKSVKEWWFDAYTFEVIDYFNKVKPNQRISLKTSWLFHPSFSFYKCTGKIPLIDLKDYSKTIDTNDKADYYYIMSYEYNTATPGFEIAYFINKDQWLVKGKASLIQKFSGWKIGYVNLFDFPPSASSEEKYQQDGAGNSFYLLADEFSPGFYGTCAEIFNANGSMISASVKVSPLEETDTKLVNLVISHEKQNKIIDYYMSTNITVNRIKPNVWTTLNVSGNIVNMEPGDGLKIYLWNPSKKKIRMDDLVIHYQ